MSKFLNRIKLFFRNVLYRHGVQLKLYVSPKAIYNKLKEYEISVQQYELRNVSEMLSSRKDNSFYDNLLRRYIPHWQLKYAKAHFIKGGKGNTSLNSYRIVQMEDKKCFEKVYFTNSRDLKVLQWLEEILFPDLLIYEIKTPQIYKYYRGEVITIVYFSFLKLESLKSDIDFKLVKITEVLYRMSKKHKYAETITCDLELRNYKLHFMYKKNIPQAHIILQNNGINCENIENIIKKSKFVLSHGDIHRGNVFENNIVIDWDSFGIYPLGFDVAYLYFKGLKSGLYTSDFESWLKSNYKNIISEAEWNVFELSFVYFTVIFSIDFFDMKTYHYLKENLISRLKSHS